MFKINLTNLLTYFCAPQIPLQQKDDDYGIQEAQNWIMQNPVITNYSKRLELASTFGLFQQISQCIYPIADQQLRHKQEKYLRNHLLERMLLIAFKSF